jgi:hypothetical protein
MRPLLRRVTAALLAAVALASVGVTTSSAPTVTAQAPIGAVIVEGTGNGHGRGLSQWGAYGWSVDRGWDWLQILDWYYGNTTMGDVPTTERMTVRLVDLDAAAAVGVIGHGTGLTVSGPGMPTVTAASVRVVRNPGGWFDVFTDPGLTCGAANYVGSGSAATMTTVTSEDPASDPALAVGVCQPNGSVVHYRGAVRVVGDSTGTVRVVNDVGVEDYLRGVVPREVSASWGDAGGGAGMNALRAQAVAARSYGLAQNRYTYARTCDTPTCQVYDGAATRPSPTGAVTRVQQPQTDRAIAETAGKVRRWSPGAPGAAGTIVSTEFSASNGPRTAGWPFPVRDDAPGDGTSRNPLHRWTRTLDPTALASRYGLGTLLSVSQVDGDPRYDGIWYNDVVLVGTSRTVRVDAWTFRNNHGFPSPGFTVRTEKAPARPMAANQRIELPVVGTTVTGTDGVVRTVPGGISAVALNITAVGPAAAGFVTVWPCDVARPDASNLNFATGSVVANGVIAPVGASGRVCFWTSAQTDFLVDIAGWYAPSTPTRPTFTGATPTRVVDTRNGIGAPRARITPGAVLTVPIGGRSLRLVDASPVIVPSNATAVAVNVTAVSPAAAGFITVWPCGTTRPTTSNVNFLAGSVVANSVVAPLGAGGSVCVSSDQTTDVLVDVLGWFGGGPAPAFVGVLPDRLVDTRNAIGGPAGLVTPATPRAVPIRGRTVLVNGVAQRVPADASAVALNVTIVGSRAAGFATVWPCGTARPDTSNVNFPAGGTVANGVVAPIGPDGSVCVFTSADAHLLVDISGWFAGGTGAAFVGHVPKRLVDTRNSIGPLPI